MQRLPFTFVDVVKNRQNRALEEARKKDEEAMEEARMKAEGEKIAGSGCLQTKYTHKFNKSGMLDDYKIEICVCSYEPESVVSHEKCRDLWHPALLRNFGYDPTKNLSIYMKYSCTLEEYIKERFADDEIELVMIDILPSSYCVKGEDLLVYHYVPNEYRKFMKVVLDFMFYLCGEGVVLRDLDWKNHMAVQEKKLVFHSLIIEEGANVDLNFKLAADMFESLFNNLPKPLEVTDFISSLRGFQFENHNREVLNCHLAVLQTNERLDRIRTYFEQTKFINYTDAALHVGALKNMGDEYKLGSFKTNDWTEFFTRPHSRFLGPLHDCFTNNQQRYQHDGSTVMKNAQLIRYARHSVAHLNEHFLKHSTSRCTRVKVDGMIMAVIGKPLLDYHKNVSNTDLMKLFL